VVSDSFVTDSASNGLVGLAFSRLNTIRPNQQKTFFDNIMADLTLPVFTAQLISGGLGAYEFGNIDTTAFVGNLTTVPVDSSRGFWEITSAAAKVGGVTTAIPNGKAIVDTGTSLMLVGDEMLVAYWNTVDGAQLSQQAGGVIFPCNTALPDLQVAVGNTYFATVKGDGMNFAEVGTDRSTGTNCKFSFSSFTSCHFAFFSRNPKCNMKQIHHHPDPSTEDQVLICVKQFVSAVSNPTKASHSPSTATSFSSRSSSSSTALALPSALHRTRKITKSEALTTLIHSPTSFVFVFVSCLL